MDLLILRLREGEALADRHALRQSALKLHAAVRLSRDRAIELAQECIQLYMWDRLGCDN